MNLNIYLFSYNRGKFLKNCLSSIQQCMAEYNVTIIDDNSNDLYTVQLLNDLSESLEIIHHNPEKKEYKTGGLYGNMNFAMNHAQQIGCDYCLFIQDDMQLVRPFTQIDTKMIEKYFSTTENAIEYDINFLREERAEHFFNENYINESETAYMVKEAYQSGKSNFSATGIFHVKRFFNWFQEFEVGEGVNSNKAIELGIEKGFSTYPITCWLPYPKSYRGKQRNFMHELIELVGGAGYHPIRLMNEDEIRNFMSRPPEDLPIMERFLRSSSAPRQDRWSTGGGEYNLVARGGLPAMLWEFAKKLKAK